MSCHPARFDADDDRVVAVLRDRYCAGLLYTDLGPRGLRGSGVKFVSTCVGSRARLKDYITCERPR